MHFFRAYQLEKDEGSEFTATIFRAVPSTSKTSLTVQPIVIDSVVLFSFIFSILD